MTKVAHKEPLSSFNLCLSNVEKMCPELTDPLIQNRHTLVTKKLILFGLQ